MGRGARLPPQAMPAAAHKPSGSERRSWKRKSPYNGQEIEGLIVFRAELLKRKAEKTADIVLPEPRDKQRQGVISKPDRTNQHKRRAGDERKRECLRIAAAPACVQRHG